MERTKQVAALTRLVATMPILACLVGCGVICEDAPCSSDLLILNEIDIEGTEGCVDVIGDLKIGPSEDLIDLELPCLTSVNGSFQIQENRAIEKISMPNLERVLIDFSIESNDSIEDLSGFQSLEAVGYDLTIANNGSLCEEHAEKFARSIEIVGGWTDIHDNEGVCD